MYGSSFIIVTRRPRASRMAASEAAAMPLPREDTTPPVTKTREGVDPVGVMAVEGLENGILPGVHRGVLARARNRPACMCPPPCMEPERRAATASRPEHERAFIFR